jgi:hypothetical protein
VIDSSFLDKYIADGIEARRSISVKEIVGVPTEIYERLKNGGKLITFETTGLPQMPSILLRNYLARS